MRRAKSDTPIDAAGTAELLDVHARHQPTEAVANEIDAATPDVSAKVFPQGQRSLIDSGT